VNPDLAVPASKDYVGLKRKAQETKPEPQAAASKQQRRHASLATTNGTGAAMNPIQTRIRIAAFGFATALALACTVGLGALFEYGNGVAPTEALAQTAPQATEVAILPATIEVVATRERVPHANLISGWIRRYAG
jgi:hypothetical protein